MFAKDADGVDDDPDACQFAQPSGGVWLQIIDLHRRQLRPALSGGADVPDSDHHIMSRIAQSSNQRLANHAASSSHQHPPARPPDALREILRRAVGSGTIASLMSTAVVSLISFRHTGSAVSGTNASSHWIWDETAKHKRGRTLRYTAIGYLIHHASSIFWAVGYERFTPPSASPARAMKRAALTSMFAYLVDYHVVPRRLTPGFEARIPHSGLACTYAAFALGLCAPRLWRAATNAARAHGGTASRRR